MENVSWQLLALPAFVALALKLVFLHYARQSTASNNVLSYYFVFIAFLAVQNIVEVSHFYRLSIYELPVFEITVYYVAILLASSSFFALAAHTSYSSIPSWAKHGIMTAFATAVVLSALILFTSWLITGYERIGYSISRIPGPAFFAVEVFVFLTVGGAISLLTRGIISPDTPRRQMMNVYMLFAIIPLALTAVGVFLLLRVGIRVNATIAGPIATTFFLALTLYAVGARNYFFELPFPSRREFQTKFKTLINELPKFGTAPKAIDAIGNNLNCTAALLDHGPPIVSTNRRPNIEYANVNPEYQAAFRPESGFSGRIVFADGLWDRIVSRKDVALLKRLIERFNHVFMPELCTPEVKQSEQEQRARVLAQALHRATQPEQIAKSFFDRTMDGDNVDDYVQEIESAIYRYALDECSGNLTKAARRLGVSNTTFHYRLRKYGIPTPNPKRRSRRMRF